MKLITAIVKPDKLDDLIGTIVDSGARGLTVTEVRGFGRQYGQLATAYAAKGTPTGLPAALLPKIRLDVVVSADHADEVAEAIAKCAGTGTIGDGKIWITPVDGLLRVRTGERDSAAL
jgi:nitrogen regulatory protein PII